MPGNFSQYLSSTHGSAISSHGGREGVLPPCAEIQLAIAFSGLAWPHLVSGQAHVSAPWDRWVEASQRGGRHGARGTTLSFPFGRRGGTRFGLAVAEGRRPGGPSSALPLALAFPAARRRVTCLRIARARSAAAPVPARARAAVGSLFLSGLLPFLVPSRATRLFGVSAVWRVLLG